MREEQKRLEAKQVREVEESIDLKSPASSARREKEAAVRKWECRGKLTRCLAPALVCKRHEVLRAVNNKVSSKRARTEVWIRAWGFILTRELQAASKRLSIS